MLSKWVKCEYKKSYIIIIPLRVSPNLHSRGPWYASLLVHITVFRLPMWFRRNKVWKILLNVQVFLSILVYLELLRNACLRCLLLRNTWPDRLAIVFFFSPLEFKFQCTHLFMYLFWLTAIFSRGCGFRSSSVSSCLWDVRQVADSSEHDLPHIRNNYPLFVPCGISNITRV